MSVCLSVHPASFLGWGLGVGLVSWSRLTPLPFLPPQGGDGYVDTESKFLKLVAAIKAALAQAMCPEGGGEGAAPRP